MIFQTFENQDALVQAIKTGQVDVIAEMPNTAVRDAARDPNIAVVTGAPFAPAVTDIIFNQVTHLTARWMLMDSALGILRYSIAMSVRRRLCHRQAEDH